VTVAGEPVRPAGPLLPSGLTAWHFWFPIVCLAVGIALLETRLSFHGLVTFCVYLACVVIVAADPRWAYYLLPITVPWGSLLPLSIGSSSLTPTDAIVATLLLSFFVWLAGSRLLHVPYQPWLVALTALISAMLLSILGTESISASIPEIVKWTEVLVTAALTPMYLTSQREIWRVLTIAVASASAEALLGLGQFLLHKGPKAFEYHHRFLRAFGTFGQPNPLAGYLNMILPVTVALAFLTRRQWLWIAALVIGAGSLATLSRAGWAAAALALIVVACYYLRWARVVVSLGAVAAALFVLLTVLGTVPVQPLASVANSFGLNGVNFAHHTHANFSEIERAAHWVAGLRMFAAHPLVGVGIGNYATAYPAYHVADFTAALGHAHDYFINIAAETGIFGLVTYTLFVTTGFITCVRQARNYGTNVLAGAVAIGILGLWTSTIFHNLFDVMYVHEMPVLLGLMMGLLVAAALVSPVPATRSRALSALS